MFIWSKSKLQFNIAKLKSDPHLHTVSIGVSEPRLLQRRSEDSETFCRFWETLPKKLLGRAVYERNLP